MKERIQLLDKIALNCPNATLEEQIRFLRGKNYKLDIATEKLTAYLEWRKEHGLNDDDWNTTAEDDWKTSSQKAFRKVNKNDDDATEISLPQILFTIQKGNKKNNIDDDTTKNQMMVLHLIPARIDTKVASLEVYSLTIAYYLDRQLDRHVDQAACVLLDTRRGVGWPNTKAFALMSFIRQTTNILQEMFPERLAKCILFNVPLACKWLWEMAKPFLDPSTRNKVVLCSGKDDPQAEAPQKTLGEIVSLGTLERMEKMRRSLYVEN